MTWRLIYSRKIQKDVEDLCRRAQSEGRLALVLDILQRLTKRLKTDPLDVGEPYNRMKHYDLLLCVFVEGPLVVDFAIDDARHWVYLRRVELLE